MKIWSNTCVISLTDCEISDVKNTISLVTEICRYTAALSSHGYRPWIQTMDIDQKSTKSLNGKPHIYLSYTDSLPGCAHLFYPQNSPPQHDVGGKE